MAIRSRSGPGDGADRVAQALSALSFSRAEAPDLAVEYGGAIAPSQLSRPLPVYGIDLTSIEDLAFGRRDLDALPQSGWRYLVLDDSGIQAADLAEGSERPTLQVGGDMAERIAAAGRLAERRVDQDTDYEPRLLDPAFLGEPVLWLKSTSRRQADRFFSLRLKPRELSRDHLVRRLAAAAARKIRAFERTEGAEADESGDADEIGG